MSTETREILDKLDGIRSDLEYIRKHLVDVDFVLTDDDLNSLEEAEKDYKNKKTSRLV